MRRNIVTLAAVAAAVVCGAAERRFEPDGARDRTAEVLAAIENGATLRFAKGEYHFRSPAKLRYYISNHDNPQPHKVFLPVTNVTDLVVNGNGAVFVFHGSGIGLTLMDTRRVTVKGIAFEWARPPFSEAKVVTFDGNGAVLKPDPVRFPLTVERRVPACMAFQTETAERAWPTRPITRKGERPCVRKRTMAGAMHRARPWEKLAAKADAGTRVRACEITEGHVRVEMRLREEMRGRRIGRGRRAACHVGRTRGIRT